MTSPTGAPDPAAPVTDAPPLGIALDPLHAEAERISGMGSWIWEVGKGTFWSDGLYRIMGLEPGSVPASETSYLAAVHPDDQPLLRALTEAAFRGQPGEVEHRLVRPDGEVRWVRSRGIATCDADGQLVRLMGAVLDLTERKRLEEHLQHSARLQAVGTLAAGLAHDFNNYLLVIGANLELMTLGNSTDREHLLAQARHALDQCAALTRQLLALARRQPSSPVTTHVRGLLEHTASMLKRPLGAHIAVVVEAEPDDLHICVDAGQIEQALVNLAVNARDAMPSGGRIVFEAGRAELAAVPRQGVADGAEAAHPERWVRISVSDTGQGIAPHLLAHIFEPYFTTKGVGRGTGLGLASVYALVTQNGGRVTVHSQLGEGTRFDLWFPAHEAPAPETAAPPVERAATSPHVSVLVVEDMDSVRAVVVRALRMAGYGVLEAPDGRAALDVLEGLGTSVDLLLTDVVMPRLGGIELAAAVREQYPATRILFMTGCAEQDQLDMDPADVLVKPFRPAELLERVRQTLERG